MAQIRYLDPLERSYQRMKEQLFRPFDLSKWIVLGFACWLARLAHGGGGLQFPSTGGWDSGDSEAAVLEAVPTTASGGLLHGIGAPEIGLVGCVIVLVVAILALAVVVAWVSARGQFLFVDNAVTGQARIVVPWKEFRREGNSLFLWQLGWMVVAVLTLLVALTPAIIAGVTGAFDDGGPGAIFAGALTGAMVLVWLVIALYVSFFLTAFVVPIMHRERLKAMEAWRVFLALFKQHPGKFVLVGLFYAAISLLVGLAVLIAGLVTCCILFIVLIVPFIGTVALLPVYLTTRYFTLEFLAQFSPRFDFFDAATQQIERDTVELPAPAGEPPPPAAAPPAAPSSAGAPPTAPPPIPPPEPATDEEE